MNRSYRLCWNRLCAAVAGLVGCLLAASAAWAGPTGGQVTGGSGQITQSGNVTTIDQTSQTLTLNWQSFNVGTQQTVVFDQPNASALAINRIDSSTGSQILGRLDANGQVWLINPNGVLFGANAQVNVGGLVASTLDLADTSGTTAQFRGDGHGAVVNDGTITAASGGYVALLGHQVSNQGTITAQLGTVALGAGSGLTLTFSGNHLLHLQVDQSTLDDLVANGQLIEANGGRVIMTAGARDSLLASVVNNTGVVQAETVASHDGTIDLLGGGSASTVRVAGTLDAGAPHGGNGGAIETSAAHVEVAASAQVTAGAPHGHAGTWLVDPTDLTIDSTAATAINTSLNSGTSVTEQTTASGASGFGTQSAGAGDINVDAAISWTNPAASLTLLAYNGINVNAPISGAGQVVMNAAGANLTLGASGTVSAQGGITLGTAGNFVNNAGASALSVGSSATWLVYSTNPTLDTTGGLAPSFIQYNAAYGATPAVSGSGFLYSVAPTITFTGLTGTVSKVYDGTTTATLAGSNMTASGLINGDTIISGTGSYASANAGTSINVTSPASVSALSVTNAGGVPVYGYALGPTVTAAVGTITPAPLTATIVGDPTKVYDGTTTATLSSANYSVSGFIGTQGATVNQPGSVAYGSASAGAQTITATLASPDFVANSGTSLANYQLPTTATGVGTITPAPLNLTGVLANGKVYDGTTTDSLSLSGAGIFGVIAPDAGQVTLVTSGASGTFASANVGSNIAVTPVGFTLTGAKAADYTLIVPTDLTASITPAPLTITGVAATGKVYDSTTTDTLNVGSAALSGVVASDVGDVTLASGSATGTFASPNVGSNIAVAASGFGLTGTAAGNYTLEQPGGLAASITPAPLTISLVGNPIRLYNGSTTAIVPGADFSISGFVGSQSATIPQNAQAEYATANAGSGIAITATLEDSDFSLASGTLLSNYSFSRTVTGTGTINPVTLSGFIANNPTKVYDGTTTGTVASADYVLYGLVGSDSITVNQTSGTYASANAGPEPISASLTAGDFTAVGSTLLSNYVLPSSLTGPGTIQPKALGGNNINGSIVGNPTKTYDGTTTATLTSANYDLTGWVGSDGATVTQTVGQYSSANAGAETVTATLTPSDFVPEGTTNLSNYVLPTVVYGTGTINPALLAVSIIGNPTKVYDGTTTAVLAAANYQISGFVSGEGATIVPASFSNYASKNVGEQTITATLTSSAYSADSGTLLSNYVLATTATGTGDITAAPLYVTGVSAGNKVYDTTTAATLGVGGAGLSGLVAADVGTVTLNTSTSGTFSQADVGNNLAVTANGFSISGSGASNYALQPITGLQANITPALLTISGVLANNKVYDATTTATLSTSSASLNGVLGSDAVTLSTSGASATFESADAGNGIPVTASGFTLGGSKAFDYSLSQPSGLSANITPAPITATITGNPTKAYDGTNSATLTAGDYTLTGFVTGQSATVPQSATANYLSANAGTNVGLQSTLVISDFVAGSGTNLANYIMPSTASGTLGTITPMVLNLSGTRVYDTTTNAAGTLFGTLTGLDGDTLTASGTGVLASKDVGTESFASFGTLALVANGSALASNYTLVGGTDSVRITPATLTVSGTSAASKVYDGTSTAALSGATLVGVLGSDSVTLGDDSSGNFATKNVGNGIAVGTSMTLSGSDAGNYTLTQPGGLTANITPLGITVTATGVNKVYDGTVNDAAVLSSSGVVAGDNVVFTDTSATFADPNVGNGKTVSVSGIGATGADAGDYTLLNSTATSTADITPFVLNLTGARVYDANTDAAASLFGSSGVLTGANSETLTLSGTGTLSSKNVNAEQSFASLSGFTLTGNGSALASNYTLTGGTDWVDITPAPLTVSGTSAASKVYDGTTTAALSGAALVGVIGSDNVTLGSDSTGTFATKNVGTNIAVSTAMTIGGADAGNYTLAQPSGLEANITPLGITVTATGANRVYNGSVNDAATLSSSGVVTGDSVTFADTSATFASPNVGTGLTVTVTGISASGANAGDYTLLNTTATTTANITPFVLNLTGTRVYDANTDAAATLFGSSGVLTGTNGETLTLSGTGTLSSKNVNAEQSFVAGTGLSGFTLTGNGSALASNYTFTGGTDWVDITKLAITVTATAPNKVYNGNTTETGVTLASSGILGTDTVTFSDTSATFASKNVATGITVTVHGIAAGGTDGGNYSVNSTATTTANITPKPITVTATGTNEVYSGSVNDPVTLASAGIVSGDTVTFADTSATFASPNVGTGLTVTVNGITAGGASAGNYQLNNTTATTTANITPYVLSLTGTRVYDAGTDAAASLFGSSGVLTGTNGETLTLSGTGTLSSKNVNAEQSFLAGTGLSGFTLTGNGSALASNYTFTGGTDWVDITPLAITVTATGANKVYNGTTADPGVTFSAGVITGDVVNFADASATFASKNVGTGIAVAVSGITASGTDAGNYTLLNTTASTTANITPKPITVTATGSNIVYNTGVNDSVTLSSAGIVSGDTVTFADTSATFAGPNVGSGVTVTVSGITDGGASAGNYSLSNTTATTTANITPAPLTVTGTTAAGKVYDGTTAAALSGATLVGVLGSDVVTLGNDAIGTFATKNVGSNIAVTTAMTIGGASAGNYSLAQPTGITATITPYVLSLTGTRAYNGTASAAANLFGTAGVLTGVGSETLTLSGTGTLSSKNVNAAQSFASLSGFTLTGIGSALASDYTLTGGTDFVDITPATLTVSGTTAASRVYNGSATASLSGATLVGVFGSDVVTLGNDTTGTFATANAGNGIAVTTAMTIGGTGASNYTLTQPTGLTANITPYVLSLTGTRVYDAGTDAAASLFGTAGTLTGTNGETLTLSGTGTLSSKDVSAAQTFASLSGFTLTGNGSALASNYTLVGGTDSVDITPASLTVTGTAAASKIYDGTTTAALSGASLAGVLGSDAVTLGTDTTGTFASKNVGSNIAVTTAMTLGGTDAGNYTLTQPTGLTASITPYVLNLAGTRVYDGGTDAAASLFGSGGVLTGVAGETLTLSGTGTLSSKDVNPAQSFASLSGFTLTGNGSALVSNYTLVGGTDSVDITAATLTVTGTSAAGKVYDGTTTASLSGATLSGVIGADNVTLGNDSTGTFATANAGSGITVSTGMTIGGADAGNYTLTQPAGLTANITPYVLTLTGTRVYDGTTNAAASLFGTAGVLTGVGSQTLTLSGTGTLSSKDVNPSQSFASLSGFTLTGNGSALASNYTLAGGSDSVDITPASLTVTGTTAAGRMYDGTTVASLSGATLSGVIGGDAVTLGNDATGTFATANVGSGIGVTTAMTIGGADAGNYTLSQPGGITANITPYVLNLAGTRVYDGSTDAAASLFGTAGVLTGVAGETLTLSGGGTLSSKDVNPAQSFASLAGLTITGNGSALASNYTLVGGSDSVDITPATLAVTGTTAAGKVYDGTTTASLSGATLSGVIGGDVVTLGNDSTGTFATQNAGSGIAVTTAMTIGGADAGNYTLTQPAGITANITPYVLSLSGTRVYDGSTDANASLFGTAGVLTGVGSETLTLSGSGTLSSKNVSASQSFASLAGLTLTGNGSTLASNYTLVGGTDSVDITPATLTVTGATAAGKVYDGDTTATLSGATLSGVFAGDAVTLGSDTTGTFATANAGSGIAVTTAMTISGADAGNYTIVQPTTLAANITPFVLNLTGTRVYDATTTAAASLFGTAGVLTGINGATLTLSGSGTLSSKNVSTAGTFASLSGFTLTGNGSALAGNYTLASGTDWVDITPATLTVTGTTAAGKVYDGNALASLSGATLSGVFAGDVVTLGNDATGAFATKNVGQDIDVATAMTISGADAGNYTIVQPTTLVASITPKPITITATGTNMVYNGGTADKVTLESNGVVGGDTVDFTDSSATFATPTVGNDKTVTVSGIGLTGPSSRNYTLINDATTTTADILPSDGAQQTAVAVTYLELSPDAVATPYGMAPSDSPGELTSNRKMLHQSVERNEERRDFTPGLSLNVIDGGVRMPPGAE
jgi:filamentous hemagglutinin family protein